jgi:putative nucleotide binding protein
MTTQAEDDGTVRAIVLDYLARGLPDDDRSRFRQSPVAYAVGERDFTLYEFRLADGADLTIDDTVVVAPEAERNGAIEEVREVEYDAVSGGARSELEYVVEELVEDDQRRFVDFYNEAQPITLRLHQLDLLPGIGKKLRNGILDARKRRPFEDFEDVEERVSGLHDAEGVVVERILEEFRDEDLKYRNFVGEE